MTGRALFRQIKVTERVPGMIFSTCMVFMLYSAYQWVLLSAGCDVDDAGYDGAPAVADELYAPTALRTRASSRLLWLLMYDVAKPIIVHLVRITYLQRCNNARSREAWLFVSIRRSLLFS